VEGRPGGLRALLLRLARGAGVEGAGQARRGGAVADDAAGGATAAGGGADGRHTAC